MKVEPIGNADRRQCDDHAQHRRDPDRITRVVPETVAREPVHGRPSLSLWNADSGLAISLAEKRPATSSRTRESSDSSIDANPMHPSWSAVHGPIHLFRADCFTRLHSF